MATGSHDSVRPEAEEDRDSKNPVDQEILPEQQISVPAIGTNKRAWPICHQLPRQGGVFRDEKVIGRLEKHLQLQEFCEVAARRAWEENPESSHDVLAMLIGTISIYVEVSSSIRCRVCAMLRRLDAPKTIDWICGRRHTYSSASRAGNAPLANTDIAINRQRALSTNVS